MKISSHSPLDMADSFMIYDSGWIFGIKDRSGGMGAFDRSLKQFLQQISERRSGKITFWKRGVACLL